MLLVLAFLLLLVLPKIPHYQMIFGIKSSELGMVAFAGAIGGIVSIMVRIKDFSDRQDVDKTVLFFTGLFKPFVGAAFALFVLTVLRSGIIPVTINVGAGNYFFLAVSFVSGFSERFAKDIEKTAESQIVGPAKGK